MSLGIVLKGPEGIVLAADSRATLEARQGNSPPRSVHFDNATKILSFKEYPHVGAVTYGGAVIGQRTPHSYVPEFENELKEDRLSVQQFAQKLSEFFQKRLKEAAPIKRTPGADTIFVVGGYDKDQPYGTVYLFAVPRDPKPQPRNARDFGITWGGQPEIVNRLIQGYDPNMFHVLKQDFKLSDGKLKQIDNALRSRLRFPIPYEVLSLQDGVNLATLLIRTTISMQSLSLLERGVGGPIDVATITRTDGLQFIQKKEIQGENINL